MSEPEIDTDRIDEAVLALMFLTLHREYDEDWSPWRAWKSFDWDALGRLHGQDLIHDPVNKAKSVVLTAEGRQRCEDAFYRLFGKGEG
ncbi:DUF6429 family protein [Sphingomonas sanxanigenens]|uniref:DUF6429 domain-containing protein n=1 Tax=Sphingomonas sanxanigenens DSM 19645 = NX02 TaxID=1123269 RepID=W0A669_9SPHN|nr:DUF6429 family protein [Sphingomonas sanxanigenens]AHE52531.1 hypothetical protein NX02_03890 [Sphingomonas sanxanigenens DSM 19645 = NX02]